MKVTDLTLDQWQSRLDEFRKENTSAPSGAAFRIDGTPFSTARHYGGFTYNGAAYTTFECKDTPGEFTCKYAVIAVRMDMLKWVTKKLNQKQV